MGLEFRINEGSASRIQRTYCAVCATTRKHGDIEKLTFSDLSRDGAVMVGKIKSVTIEGRDDFSHEFVGQSVLFKIEDRRNGRH
jgi:hypothetical protein